MSDVITVHGRVMERHPEIRPEDVAHAWANRIASATRYSKWPTQYMAIGFDENGRMLEMAAVEQEDGTLLVFHATIPPSAKTLREVGLR